MELLKTTGPHPAMTASSMVERYLKPRGISDVRVLDAMARVPRHDFVPEALREKAYADIALPIGDDQTISQPYIVALMTQALGLTGTEKVLEIGTGSGYQTAVLACLAKRVFSVERHHRLATQARRRLESLGHHNVSIAVGNGALGWREYAPFDRILVTASSAEFPQGLFDQLAEGGLLVVPIGSDPEPQRLERFRRAGGRPERSFLCYCSFVPFVV